MSDKEVALRIIEINGSKYNSDTNVKLYLDVLDVLKENKSDTIIGKIEELLYEYDNLGKWCDYDRIKLIDDIRKLLKENEVY